MKRSWNWQRDVNGAGTRFAEALGCISTEEYVRSVLALVGALEEGKVCRIIAQRVKFDPEGNELSDHSKPGDYLTVAYRFSTRHGEDQETWEIEREPNFEGERIAGDFATALGLHSDRGFCESMMQIKCALDRFGGQAYVQPMFTEPEGEFVGVACQYEHLVRGEPREPDSSFESSGPQDNGSTNEPESLVGPPEDQEEESPDPAVETKTA